MRKATRRWFAAGLGVLAALLAINAGLAFQKTRQLRESSDWVSHTHQVRVGLEAILSTLGDAETGQRGFLITGRDDYMRPYHQALVSYGEAIERVERLTADNLQQQADIPRLRELVAKKFNELQKVITIRQVQGFEAAQQEVSTDNGKRTMDAIRSLVGQMQGREQQLLESREKADDAAYSSALATIWISAALGLFAIVAFVVLLQQHLRSVVEFADQLYEQGELLRATLKSIGDAVIATDVTGKVTLINDVAQKLTGWREADAKGASLESVFQIVNEDSRKPVTNPAVRAIAEGKIMGLANHTLLISKDGVEWPIDDSAAPIKNEAGEVRGAILVFREIKARKQQEQELRRHATALAEADHRKDEFLAMLAHELRNPLAPISNALQIWPFVENDRSQLENLRTIMERQLQLLIRLIDDLLDISRITRGKIQLRKQHIDLATIVASAVEAVKPLVDSCGHRLTITLPERPVVVDADVERLSQVFGNILNNAAKYTGREGVIWVQLETAGNQAIVRIRDNGPGIPSQMLGEIFELFRQVDGTLSRSHGGLGIGLTLVKRLVEEHGGAVEARSQGPGQGSEFIVTLPLAAPDGQPPHEPRNRMRHVAGIPRHRTAVVDDVKASAETIAMMLRAIGQDVTTFNDGPSAIEWILANNPDLVFLDIAMPGMDGYQVAQRLRSERPSLVLVALTGYGQNDDRRQAFEAGFDHHLVKPASIESFEQLLSAIRQEPAAGASKPN